MSAMEAPEMSRAWQAHMMHFVAFDPAPPIPPLPGGWCEDEPRAAAFVGLYLHLADAGKVTGATLLDLPMVAHHVGLFATLHKVSGAERLLANRNDYLVLRESRRDLNYARSTAITSLQLLRIIEHGTRPRDATILAFCEPMTAKENSCLT